MKYILYFGGYDNDTYFYDTLEELLKQWNCKSLDDFKKEYYSDKYIILKIEKIILESQV